MGQSLNLRVIAGGVETAEHLEYLWDHNCDEAQGYFLGEPVSPEKLSRRSIRVGALNRKTVVKAIDRSRMALKIEGAALRSTIAEAELPTPGRTSRTKGWVKSAIRSRSSDSQSIESLPRYWTRTEGARMYKARNAAIQSSPSIPQQNDDSTQINIDLELRVEVLSARLKAANLETEAFSCSVAHELRGPLQMMSNLCYLIHSPNQGELSDERTLMLDQVCASVTTMAKMIDDLLELSHTTGAKLQMKQVDLSLLTISILNGLARTDPDRKVVTSVEPGCLVTADPALIQIALQNLLRNAWKFTVHRDPAQIEFGCTHRLIGSIFHVRDNGAGFDPRSTDRLFKPFQRLHSATSFPGIGIGLATIRRIIDRHGGEVWAEGEVGKGATFYFTLQSPEP